MVCSRAMLFYRENFEKLLRVFIKCLSGRVLWEFSEVLEEAGNSVVWCTSKNDCASRKDLVWSL